MKKQNRYYSRTDLACETDCPGDAPGIRRHARRIGTVRMEEMTVSPGDGEESSGRSAGRYTTLHCGEIWNLTPKEARAAAEVLGRVLRTFLTDALGHAPNAESGILVAGLGNRFITPDSIGPRTADLVTVTNHASAEGTLLSLLGCARVSAIAPGVLGQTGVETAALVADAARRAEADAVIAVDALAARATQRLATTVQISDTGIRPGSGIGNCRTALTKETVGVPVIALGVPTVVDSATLVWDVLSQAGITEIDDSLRTVLEGGSSYIVSPRESDRIASAVADLLSGALNRVLTPAIFPV